MTFQTLEKKLKVARTSHRHENETFMKLMRAYPPSPIQTAQDHEQSMKILEILAAELAKLETSKLHDAPIKRIMDGISKYTLMLAELVEHYEKKTYETKSAGRDTLKFLMEQHGITQTDLAEEFGGQSVVSDILSGKRSFNVSQIQALADRFKVSPASFFPID